MTNPLEGVRIPSPPPAPAAPPAPAPVPPAAPAAVSGPALDPEQYARIAVAIEQEIGKVIVGQAELVRHVVTCLLCEGHVLLEGPPGLGKTQLLKTLASICGLPFARIQFTPDLMPADIVGTHVLATDDGGHQRFEFRPGPVFAAMVLADEINRATPKTQSAMLEAMAERTVTVAGRTWGLPRPFLVMATQNPIEMEGTYPLPEAQLDRFLLKAVVPFPSAAELVEIMDRTTTTARTQLYQVTDANLLGSMITLTRSVPTASHVVRHAVDLVTATHPGGDNAPPEVKRYVRYGASPRGAQALLLAAKAAALLAARPNTALADVRRMVLPALRHRIGLGYEAMADDVTVDAVLDAVLAAVPEPRP